MERYWVYMDAKVQGPVEVPALRKMPGFNLLTQVCAESNQHWRMADEIVEIKSYFLAPPRASSLPMELGNTAPAIETLPQLQVAPSAVSVLEVLPAKNMPRPMGDVETLPTSPTPVVETPPPGGGALRLVCETCGYKNPRDLNVCMKCGGVLKKPTAAPANGQPPPISLSMEDIVGIANQAGKTPATAAAATDSAASLEPEPTEVKITPMVEIPLGRICLILGITAAVSAGGFMAFRHWHLGSLLTRHRHVAVAPMVTPMPVAPPPVRTHHASKHLPRKHYALRKNLPGVNPESPTDSQTDGEPAYRPRKHQDSVMPADEPPTTPASYRVVSEATPLKHRDSAPEDSPYAKKRRAEKSLWVSQSDPSVQLVQQFRIYGGLRTINRNTEILMQILRDREYNSAFETGKRIRLYNDMDWSATERDGPLYDVQLTFSGGREADGSARKPLRFAFEADLERGTVEPGGPDQIRANTMHAFFDESRIPPEDRRAIAKDTEEIVMAAQPDASPLALDTVARRFKATYGTGAMTRIADAYGLTALTKWMAREPKDTPPAATADLSSVMPDNNPPASSAQQTFVPESAAMPKTKQVKPAALTSHSGTIEYQMESGPGKEKNFTARAPSKASVAALWETITGYDRLKQFVPNLITSDREGQDGNATIVHTVSLTRFMIFVFRISLHLRVIEHPQQHTFEFERIAGDFEQFRGSMEITPGEGGGNSMITFHATVVPQGHMPGWVLNSMAERYLVPVLEAIRNHAESN